MPQPRGTYRRKAEIANRIINVEAAPFAKCRVFGCGRPTRRAAGIGLDGAMCTYHAQRRARFGSAFAPAIRATDLRPYLKTALAWIKERQQSDSTIGHALICLGGLLYAAGPVDPAQNLKRRSAEYRAQVAFARLREAGVPPERLLAVHLAVCALIEDDRDSHRIHDFRVVQVAKALHRLASGTHRRWDVPLPNGNTAPVEMHVYPKSSGRVLRLMGEAVDEMCEAVSHRDRDLIRERKREKYGPHPSQLPGWVPAWRRKLDAAKGL